MKILSIYQLKSLVYTNPLVEPDGKIGENRRGN